MIPKLVVTAAVMAAQVAMSASRRIQGPRLDNLKTTTAEYGTPINRFLGTRRLTCQIVHAEDLKEVKATSKGKGGKQTNYKYYATFMALIADHEIDGVTRVWMDDKLVMDMTNTGPVAIIYEAILVQLGKHVSGRVYLGTEDQLPDPRYESWCDDKYGPGSAPAYRGSAYMFFEDLPVNNFGNRIPNVVIEATNSKQATYPYELFSTSESNTWSPLFNGAWMAWVSTSTTSGTIEWWDAPSRTVLGVSADSHTALNSFPAMASDGTIYYMGWQTVGVTAVPYVVLVQPLGTPVLLSSSSPTFNFSNGITRVLEGTGGKLIYTSFASHTGYMAYDTYVASTLSARDFCQDADGNVWAVSHPSGSSSSFTVERLDGSHSAAFTGQSRSGPVFASIEYVSSADHFFVATDGYFYTIDHSTLSLKATGTFALSYPLQQLGQDTAWSGFTEYSLTTGAAVRTIDPSLWYLTSNSGAWYDPINQALWSHRTDLTHTLIVRYLDRITGGGVTLQTVVDTVAEWCGLTGQDTSALTQPVLGYSVTQGSGKDMIAPLLDIYDVDPRPHDFSLQFLVRGSSPTGTIVTSNFVRNGDTRYESRIQQDTDLPRRLTYNFADFEHEQQANNVTSQRHLSSVDTTREETIDLSTFVDTADDAQAKADRYLRRIWNSRERITNSLTAQYIGLEPGDVKTLSLDGSVLIARLDKLTIAGSTLNCEWVREETGLAALGTSSGPGMDGDVPDTIVIPAPTRGLAFDTPLLTDAQADVNPLLYYGAGSYTTGTWPGADVYQDDALIGSVDTDHKAVWGLSSTALGTANANNWDRKNSVNVTLKGGGILSSTTEAAITLNGALNLAILGSEILQFVTATLETDGSYTLSGLRRGRRGTEWAVSTHGIGETFAMASTLGVIEEGLGTVGTSFDVKVQTIGRDPASALAVPFSPFTGATLKPYAPAAVKWTFDGTNLQGVIVRRTRLGGTILNGTTVSLSENSEAYEIEIYNGSTLKRTISVTGTNAFSYTAAMAATDGITLPTPPSIKAYQLSDAVGRGFALAA